MNPLKDYAHLFANGKFKVDIECSRRDQPVEFKPRDLPTVRSYPQYCTLIARPIEDMSENELTEWRNSHDIVNDNRSKIHALATAYLLSIGVYPFDQGDFGETVIDSTEK